MLSVSIVLMLTILIMHHLGLVEAVIDVVAKIAKCSTCSCFWGVLAILIYLGYDVIGAMALSILMAYLSNYVGILLVFANKIYGRLWQRVNKSSRTKKRKKKKR